MARSHPLGGDQRQSKSKPAKAVKVDMAALEVVALDGELCLLMRLGRASSDPLPVIDRVRRSYTIVGSRVDTVGPFLAEATRDKHGARCRAGALYDSYSQTCERRGWKRLSRPGFYRAMLARGYRQKISNGHWWCDLEAVGMDTRGELLL